MIRWLDALGPLKWPSLLLVASPLAAYPFWLPEVPPAKSCEQVQIDGQSFTTYRLETGNYILRPLQTASDRASPIRVEQPIAFDAGGMVVDGTVLERANLHCSSASSLR